MAKYDQYYPNYEKLYPGVKLTPEVLACLRTTDRKMKYVEVDLKAEQYIPDPKTGETIRLPSREDSYERLLEEDRQFPMDELSPEAETIHADELRRLRLCMALLSNYEQRLISALYFEGLSERELACRTNTHYMTLHCRKVKILKKLKKLMSE